MLELFERELLDREHSLLKRSCYLLLHKQESLILFAFQKFTAQLDAPLMFIRILLKRFAK